MLPAHHRLLDLTVTLYVRQQFVVCWYPTGRTLGTTGTVVIDRPTNQTNQPTKPNQPPNQPTNQPTTQQKTNQPTNQTKPTNDMQLSISSAANSSATNHKTPCLLQNPPFHYLPHNSPLRIPILNQINPVHVFPSRYFKISFNIIFAAAIAIPTHK